MLGADTKKFRTKDSIQILEYAFSNYSNTNLKQKIEIAFKKWTKDNIIKIIKGKEKYIVPALEETQYENYPLKQGEEIDIILECEEIMQAPVIKGTKVGTLHVTLAGNEIMSLNITVPTTIEKKDPMDYWQDMWRILSRKNA